MKIDSWSCDVCGAQKKETNHWWMICRGISMRDGKELDPQPPVVIGVLSWDEITAKDPKTIHLCGEKCVIAKVSEFLSK